jgi:penicillin G amidase
MKLRRISLFIGLTAIVLWMGASATPLLDGPAAESTIKMDGLKSPVTVTRDEKGIPYIEASNDQDLYFAQGYITARDRLWQMDINRRSARGEMAEILGRDAIDSDKRFRTLGFNALTESLEAKGSPTLRLALESYARGVNAFIASLDDKSLPVEFKVLKYKPRPWRPADSLAVAKLFSYSLSTTYPSDLMRAALSSLPHEKLDALLTETSPLDVVTVGSDRSERSRLTKQLPPFKAQHQVSDVTVAVVQQGLDDVDRMLSRLGFSSASAQASNNWVVSGKRTASGKPMLATDPHLNASVPSVWYMTHLGAPGLRVAGVTPPGIPGIVVGHNEYIAWGVTNLMADVQDLYIETFDPANPRRYKSPDGWRTAEVRMEPIKVRKSFGGSDTETVTHEVIVTRHGPIVHQEEGKSYALRWTALDADVAQVDTFLKINRAKNWNQFKLALSQFTEPAQSFVYADVNGHIGYYGAGKIPIRASGDGTLPYDGSAGAGEWTGYIPFDSLPHVYDPPSGIIVTANNRIVGQSYPYVITREWASPYRAHRIMELLQTNAKLTQRDFRAIQGDVVSLGGRTFARAAVKVLMPLAQSENDANLLAWLKILDAWDGQVKAEAFAPVIVSELRNVFRRQILSGILNEKWRSYRWANSDTFVDRIITERPAAWLPKGFRSYDELLKKCFQEARESIATRMGPDESKWHWGHPTLGQIRFRHPLVDAPFIGQQFYIAPFPQNGSASSLITVNAGQGVSMRLIVDVADWDQTRQGIALGESGDPASPHWRDQLEDWRNVNPGPLPFSKMKIAEMPKRVVLTLKPN